VGRAYLDAVSPLDDFALTSERLCMTDLAVQYGFAKPSTVEWLKGSDVRAARRTDARGRVCVKLSTGEDYTVFRMRVRRGEARRPPLELHFKAGQRPRILGIIRVAR
jgi:hypothetical protein